MQMERIETKIISTYNCVISTLRSMPGMRVEELFRSSSLAELASERNHLQQLFEKPKCIIDTSTPEYLVGLLRNIERAMPKAQRKRLNNVVLVKRYLTAHTSKAGNGSGHELCDYLGIDPDGYTFY